VRRVTITAYLPDMLREYLDQVVKPREVPTQEDVKVYFQDSGALDDARTEIVEAYLTRKLVDMVVEQKESLTISDWLQPWAPDADHQIYLEDYYAYQLVGLLPQVVQRAQSLTASIVQQRPTGEIVHFLHEACKSYIYGLYVSCICVCRCVLEQLLEDKLKDKPVPFGIYRRLDGRQKGDIEALIDWAFEAKILDSQGTLIANRIRRRGNAAAHHGKASEREAAKVLSDIQVLLRDYFLTKRD
jgi:Domain of unknown function (DUF4145)